MHARGGKLLQRGHHVERGRVAVGILATRERARPVPDLAAGHVGNQFKQGVGRRAQRDVVAQHVAQGLAAHFHRVRRAEHGDDLIDEAGIVGWKHTEGIADNIVDARGADIEIDMPRVLFRTGAIELAPRCETRLQRRLAAATGRAEVDGFDHGWRGRRGRGRANLDGELLQHARGFLAAGRAQIEPFLLLLEQRVGVIGAIVAALAAVLLRHGGHQLGRQRLRLGEFHSLVDRHGGIVPGRVVIAGEHGAGWRRQTRRFAAAQRRRAQPLRRERRREQAGQPRSLLGGERRAFGNEKNGRRDDRRAHGSVSAASFFRAASS